MRSRANGKLAPKFIASYSRANGNSSKWECSQKNHAEWLKMGTFLVKWDSFEHSNAPKHQNGKFKFVASHSRANGNSSKWEYFWNSLYLATKWDPICSRAHCTSCQAFDVRTKFGWIFFIMEKFDFDFFRWFFWSKKIEKFQENYTKKYIIFISRMNFFRRLK